MRTWVKASIVILVVFFMVFMSAYLAKTVFSNLGGENPLPDNIDISYKEIQRRGMPSVLRYAIVDTAGYCYFVTEEKFYSMEVIQKIGDCLYREPDGNILVMGNKTK